MKRICMMISTIKFHSRETSPESQEGDMMD